MYNSKLFSYRAWSAAQKNCRTNAKANNNKYKLTNLKVQKICVDEPVHL